VLFFSYPTKKKQFRRLSANASAGCLTSPHETTPIFVNPTSQTLDACPHPVQSSRPSPGPPSLPSPSLLPSLPPQPSSPQTRTVRSSDADTNRRPSSRQATLVHATEAQSHSNDEYMCTVWGVRLGGPVWWEGGDHPEHQHGEQNCRPCTLSCNAVGQRESKRAQGRKKQRRRANPPLARRWQAQ